MAVASEFLNRAQGLTVALGFAALGLVLFAATRNLAALCAGQVFYGIGFTGIRLIVSILVSDTISFRNRSLVYAVVFTPWALTAFSVPALRRDSQSSELRPAIAAFAGIVPVLGGLLAGFLQRRREHIPKPKPLKLVIRRLRGSEASRRSWGRLLRFGLPFSTFVPLVLLLSLFVLLWLLQMDVTPWFAVLPPAVLLCCMTAFLLGLKNPRFNDWVCKKIIPSLYRTRAGFLGSCWTTNLPNWLDAVGERIAHKVNPNGLPLRQEESVLRPLRGRMILGTCALCLLWRREYQREAYVLIASGSWVLEHQLAPLSPGIFGFVKVERSPHHLGDYRCRGGGDAFRQQLYQPVRPCDTIHSVCCSLLHCGRNHHGLRSKGRASCLPCALRCRAIHHGRFTFVIPSCEGSSRAVLRLSR